MKKSECRYLVTDIVAIPILRIYKKSEAYRQATKEGWGVVDTDKDGSLFCDEDSSATLINQYGKQFCIFPYNELNRKDFFNQAECDVIIQSDSCGFSFWEKENGLVKILVTYDENGYIDNYRLTDWTDTIIYDDEQLIDFESLPETDSYNN